MASRRVVRSVDHPTVRVVAHAQYAGEHNLRERLHSVGGRLVNPCRAPIEDEANVDARRAEAGLSSLADYVEELTSFDP